MWSAVKKFSAQWGKPQISQNFWLWLPSAAKKGTGIGLGISGVAAKGCA